MNFSLHFNIQQTTKVKYETYFMIIKKLSLQIRKTEFNYFLTLLLSEMLSRITRIIPRNLSVTGFNSRPGGFKSNVVTKSSIKKQTKPLNMLKSK